MQIFYDKLPVEDKDPSMQAAQMFIIKTKVISLPPPKVVRIAVILQTNGDFTTFPRCHMHYIQEDQLRLFLYLLDLDQKTTHLD